MISAVPNEADCRPGRLIIREKAMERADDVYNYTISYGKVRVPVYRVYASSLAGIAPIPESAFTGRANTLFAVEVDVEVLGNNFLSAYTNGDNSQVVATDSMKNFVLHQALEFKGSTIESFLDLLGRAFLSTYALMEQIRVTGRELPFVPTLSPTGAPGDFAPSEVLFSRSHNDYALAMLEFSRAGEDILLSAHRCGRIGLQLLKVTGSSFSHFVRDAYTTLPERVDRPLFTYLDVFWRYADVDAMLKSDSGRYVPSEQVRDVVTSVFHEFVSESIQHLVHEMGRRVLDRFPEIGAITFEAQNRTPDPVALSESDPRVKVYTSPFSAYGLIQLTIERQGRNGG
ncbi:MAG: urate oxidase [Chloroflexi bacterium]|nr:MAG: urate oxidase [Chloroflexota bacterium]